MFNKLYGYIEKIYLTIGTVLLIALIGVVLLQVISRPLPISSPAWTEEVARFLLVYVVAFGCALATGKRELVNVDLVVSLLPSGLKKYLVLLIDLVILTCSITLMINSVEYVESTMWRMATTLPISQAWVTSSVIIITGNISLFTLFNLIRDFTPQGRK
ncbi:MULTISPECIES: TRAP transporter small permease [unclassified Escherichia]|uniref:TRAP transporter small permease n=1 Tax=unclassified Escherichia TaxID=2608889 RepID=UPI00107F13C9|nr:MULTISPECIES: TRAP transporter small permease [unclassified Escherichia]TGB93340.1 C4-dicarboxylate ABC transporter [Escherichia sp. E2748]TGC12894.1 C4-dicarboxylate ABC transporter [Escherichia sp. E4385]TGC22772.1 C4-dicarboxylate ABC transporter [Escherichia sp. E1130]TLI63511.1 TRAP transporter small permease [Escherichia sp. E1130]TLI92849.1 TRAP transporter small permease [Escherichia sp. E2748]